ncbi:MAG: NADH-quinone oxidoreductase subunit N [Bacteroidota bacterium]
MNILIAITAVGVLAMLSEILNFRKYLYPLTLLVLLVALGLTGMEWSGGVRYFNDMLYMDNFAVVFSGIMVFTTLLWFMMNEGFLIGNPRQADFTAIISFALGGALVMAGFSNLIMLFLGVEILSISMYVLAASNKSEPRSNEAGFKYFLMGAFASGFLLFGIALVYGFTAQFSLSEIAKVVTENKGQLPPIFYGGVLMIMVGLAFKVAAAPFHFWAPDVYEGAPTPFTAFMSTVVKTAAFAAFLRLFDVCFADVSSWWSPVLAVLAALTLLVGSIMALRQTSFKRLLAWSGVANAGYMLMAIVAMNEYSDTALAMYAAAYSIASIGVFTLVSNMTNEGNEQISSLHGFSSNNKFPALVITVLLFSIAGIPPLAGFFGKYSIFAGTLQSGYGWLAVVAVLSSIMSVFYYLKVIVAMYQPAGREAVQLQFSPGQSLVLGLVLVLIVVLGIAPSLLTGLL